MEEKYKIHIFYIVIIVGAIIIALATVDFATIPGFKDYVTFALTVTSIVLAILAVIYTFYANARLFLNIGSMEKSSAELSTTSSKLSDSTKELSEKVGILPEIGAKVDETHSMLADMADKDRGSGDIDTEIEITDFPEEIIDQFLDTSSYSGLMGLYAFSLSHKYQKEFGLKEAFEKSKHFNEDYTQGYILASSCFGLFDYSVKNGKYSVGEINEKLSTDLPEALISTIQNISGGIKRSQERRLNEKSLKWYS